MLNFLKFFNVIDSICIIINILYVFYMKLNEDQKTVAAVDCLVPGIGEIIGVKDHSYQELEEYVGHEVEDLEGYDLPEAV